MDVELQGQPNVSNFDKKKSMKPTGDQKQEDKPSNPEAKGVYRIGPQLYKTYYNYKKQRANWNKYFIEFFLRCFLFYYFMEFVSFEQ